MRKKRSEIFPGTEYKFEERLKELQIYIKKCFREAIKEGFPERFTRYSIKNPIKERRSVQIKFSPAIMRLLFQISKRREVKKWMDEKKEIEELDKIITVTPKEVFIISEGGLQVFRIIFRVSCKIIKNQLENKKRKRLQRIKISKDILLQKIESILSDSKRKPLMSVAYKEDRNEYIVALISGKSKFSTHDKSVKKLFEFIDNNKDFIKNFA